MDKSKTLRVPLNVLVSPETKERITGEQNKTKESQGQIVDRAVALLLLGEIVEAPAKVSKKSKAIQARQDADLLGRAIGRTDIDYASDDLPTQPVSTVAPRPVVRYVSDDRLNAWRAGRKPLLKPKDR